MLTQEKLKEILEYYPESGEFIWLKRPANNVQAGDVAGTLNTAGYIQVTIGNIIYTSHRLAWLYMTGKWPIEIDHINHIRNDNRWINIRETTHAENMRNITLISTNSSGVNGVGWYKQTKRWRSSIKVNGKLIGLGYFEDKFEAICARLSANNKHGFHPNHGLKEQG